MILTQMLKVVKSGATAEDAIFGIIVDIQVGTIEDESCLIEAKNDAMETALRLHPEYEPLPHQAVFAADSEIPKLTKLS